MVDSFIIELSNDSLEKGFDSVKFPVVEDISPFVEYEFSSALSLKVFIVESLAKSELSFTLISSDIFLKFVLNFIFKRKFNY